MEKLHDLKKKLWAELEELAEKRDMGAGDLEVVHKITDTIKNIDKICMLEDGDGYSEAVDGDDYGRGGMGDYSSRRGGRSRGGYSRDDGRCQMMEHLEMALDSASDQDREIIKRFMRQLENA